MSVFIFRYVKCMIICKAPLIATASYLEALSAASSGAGEMQVNEVISTGESYSGLQEECHSRVRDPLQQKPGSRIKNRALHLYKK